MVVPVGPHFNKYAEEVKDKLRGAGFCCDTDVDDSNTMNKKVRNAQIAQYNFIFGEIRIWGNLRRFLHEVDMIYAESSSDVSRNFIRCIS